MVTVRRAVPPGSMDSGVKLLFISAGKDKPCACTGCPVRSREKTNAPESRRDKIDLFIFKPVNKDVFLVKQNLTGAVWSATLICLVVGIVIHDVSIHPILPSHTHRLGSIDFVHLGEASTCHCMRENRIHIHGMMTHPVSTWTMRRSGKRIRSRCRPTCDPSTSSGQGVRRIQRIAKCNIPFSGCIISQKFI